jgi:hypothetical protein
VQSWAIGVAIGIKSMWGPPRAAPLEIGNDRTSRSDVDMLDEGVVRDIGVQS